ncbi:MAG: HAD-IA family hydrolase [Roseburia sp.]|nr:HAD-IA family hydrolase [Roseburia sp.]
MSNIRAVVFDMDDTLYGEYDYVLSGFAAAAAEAERAYGITDAARELISLFAENSRGVFGRFLRAHGAPSDAEARLVEVYRNHAPDISLYPDAKRALVALRERGYKTGVITDGDGERQRKKADALGLFALVDAFAVTDADKQKPQPDAFIKTAEALGVGAEQMMYVGDNPSKDFAVKKYLPVTTVRVVRGLYADCEYAEGILPDYTVSDMSELFGILEGVNA